VICQLADVRVRSAGVAAKVHPNTQVESFYFLAALIFAHRARCAAAILFLPPPLIFCGADSAASPLFEYTVRVEPCPSRSKPRFVGQIGDPHLELSEGFI